MINKKNDLKNKITAIITITFLIMSGLLLAFPSVSAQTSLPGYTAMPDRNTDTFAGASPILVGMGQQVVINAIVYPAPSGPTYEAYSLVDALNNGYSDVSVTITKPDGTHWSGNFT